MSESRPIKRKVEMIESYWTGGELGSDYQWNDNHGMLIRCKDCIHWGTFGCADYCLHLQKFADGDWYCADGEKKI